MPGERLTSGSRQAGAGTGDRFLQSALLVVDTVVEPEFVFDEGVLGGPASDAHHAGACDPGELTGQGAGSAGGGRNQENFAGRRLSDVEYADAGREPDQPQRSKVQRQRTVRRVDTHEEPFPARPELLVTLPARVAGRDQFADRPLRIAARDDLSDRPELAGICPTAVLNT